MPRHPAFRFALCGALLFALAHWLGRDAPRGDSGARAGGASDDEILYRAARARGLDRDDPVVQARIAGDLRVLGEDEAGARRGDVVLGAQLGANDLVVRRRLIERMRLLLQEPGLSVEPTDAELHAYLEAHPDRFGLPARVSLVQVFFSRSRPTAAADAQRMLERLGAADVDRAAGLGDPLPIAANLSSASSRDLARWFGDELAAAAMTLAPGRWQGPLRSPYGLHVVWVRERMPAVLPPTDSIHGALRAGWREEHAADALRAGIAMLRSGEGAASGAR